ncbi:MAG: hypothetical protein ACI9DQ_001130, partial [Glaciecola sp.]
MPTAPVDLLTTEVNYCKTDSVYLEVSSPVSKGGKL